MLEGQSFTAPNCPAFLRVYEQAAGIVAAINSKSAYSAILSAGLNLVSPVIR